MSTIVARYAIQPFSPQDDVLYNLDEAAHLASLPRHFVIVCCKHGLVSPQVDAAYGGLFFNRTALRLLQRISYLHNERGVNLAGIKIILELMDEVERLRAASAAPY